MEAKYRQQMQSLIKEMNDSVTYWLGASYKKHKPLLAQDALPSKELQKRIKELADRWIGRFNDMALKIAEDFVTKGRKSADYSFMSALRDAGWAVNFTMTRPMRDAANAAIAENVGLIKSIPQQYFTDIEGIVMRGFTVGRDLHSISEELKKRYDVTNRRAALISRDQSNKLTAVVTRARRIELGIKEAVWIHSKAGKEPRASHVAANGKVFDVEKGCLIDGKYILPGEEINCRCISKSVLPF